MRSLYFDQTGCLGYGICIYATFTFRMVWRNPNVIGVVCFVGDQAICAPKDSLVYLQMSQEVSKGLVSGL